MKKAAIGILSFMLFSLAPLHAMADPTNEAAMCQSNGINYNAAVRFAQNFRAALRSDDPTSVAHFMTYPLKVNTVSRTAGSTTIYVDSTENFIARYPSIFTDAIKNTLLNNKGIVCISGNASIGNGTAWFSMSTTDGKIFALNIISSPLIG